MDFHCKFAQVHSCAKQQCILWLLKQENCAIAKMTVRCFLYRLRLQLYDLNYGAIQIILLLIYYISAIPP